MYDTDDFLHGLPDYHKNKAIIEDGSRYLLNQDELCREVDCMTVSTDYLKQLYAKLYPGTRIEVLPNCVRTEDYGASTINRLDGERVYLGWAGSSTHYDDLAILSQPLNELMSKYEELSLVTVLYHGLDRRPYRDALGIPLERRLMIGGTEPHLMSNNTRLIDIGLAPLLINDFNRAKSNCKFLEYALCGIPMVGSDLNPYWQDREFSILAGDNNAGNGWYRSLEVLIKDKIRRRSLGADAQAYARERYDIKNNVDRWDKLLKGLVGRK